MDCKKSDTQRILLGVSGGIAAYKALDLVRLVSQAGCDVRVVMTAAAERFVTALSFQALSGHPVRCSLWDPAAEAAMGHIELARWADAVVIAPASADLIARLAAGRADDLLTTLCLATEAPLWLAPAMNQAMWRHPATQHNIALLTARGARLLGPDEGLQACGDEGPGRLLEPQAIVAALFAGTSLLTGRTVLLTAGATYEDIDPVRFIGNRSSGRMGYALAAAARDAGAKVVVVSGPATAAPPWGVELIRVRSAGEMYDAVHAAIARHALGPDDVFIATAAVADFRPPEIAADKIRRAGRDRLALELIANPDILASVAALPERPFTVGFAAETGDPASAARAKLAAKGVDLVAANRVGPGAGFDCLDNALVVAGRDFEQQLERAPKPVLAVKLIDLIAARLPTLPTPRETEAPCSTST